jgi:hypothetical protein
MRKTASRLRPAHAIGPSSKWARVGSLSLGLHASFEVSVFPRYRASRADRSFPRSDRPAANGSRSARSAFSNVFCVPGASIATSTPFPSVSRLISSITSVFSKLRTTSAPIRLATMISRMVGTPVFSDRTEFSVSTAEFHASAPLSEWTNPTTFHFYPAAFALTQLQHEACNFPLALSKREPHR